MLSPYELSGSRYAPTIDPVPVSLFYYKMRSLRIRSSLVGKKKKKKKNNFHRPYLCHDAVHHHLKVRTAGSENINQHDSI